MPLPPSGPACISCDLAIVIFAKAPVPGRCKTRLARHVGHEAATRRYRAMTEHVVAGLRARSAGPIILACSPDTRHISFKRLARTHGCRLQRQARGDLGARMHRALQQALTEHSRALVIGTDQPDIQDADLCDIDQRLGHEVDACMAPTGDGGYWMIGLSRPAASVFRGIDWSTPAVARQTRTALRRRGLSWYEPARHQDIDEYRDWAGLARSLRSRLGRAAVMPAVRTG